MTIAALLITKTASYMVLCTYTYTSISLRNLRQSKFQGVSKQCLNRLEELWEEKLRFPETQFWAAGGGTVGRKNIFSYQIS